MSSPSFSDLYWELSELVVQETESHRCDICSGITYEKFRAEDALAEFSKPKIVLIGSFLYVSKSAFAGCWVCRLLLRQISQTAMTLQATFNLYSIAMVGLRLNLDDELSVHIYDESGHPMQLNDLQADVIDLRDGEWSETFRVEDAMEEKARLEWDFDIFPPGLHDCDSNRLILNPDVEDGRLLVMSWLSTCRHKHKSCSWTSGLPELPTRILDIGKVGESRRSRLVITEGRHAEYVALSHCWGKTHHTMALTNDNIESMMDGIEDSDMPKTFQEAIMVTRGLDQQYLWIDSMCIIQPTDADNSDWEREGSKMGEIYRNSTCTIAASSANDNTEGCCFGKTASQFDVHPVPLFEKPVHRNWDPFSKAMGRNPKWFPMMNPKPASWLNHVQNSPLSQRAWVLQERILSPRILHCTMQGFFWECSELRASEYEPIGCQFDYFFRDQGLLNAKKLLAEDRDAILGRHWRKVVERYTQLGISIPSDRLPALTGLASIIQAHTGDTYIAGHWKSSLISSLLWFKLDSEERTNCDQRHNAPSWSWSSISSEVKFTSLEESDYPSRSPKDFSLAAKLESVDFEPLGTNPLNWLGSSHLALRGRLRDKSSGGLPKFETKTTTSSEEWWGYVPVEGIPQLGAVEIQRIPDYFNLTVNPENGSLPNLSLPTDDTEAGSSMASIAADHDKLQAAIKNQMQMATSSQEWKNIQETMEKEKEKAEEAEKSENSVTVIYDCAIENSESVEGYALLEILRSKFSEGLVLSSTGSDGEYKRVGYFKSKASDIFNHAPEIEVVLI